MLGKLVNSFKLSDVSTNFINAFNKKEVKEDSGHSYYSFLDHYRCQTGAYNKKLGLYVRHLLFI